MATKIAEFVSLDPATETEIERFPHASDAEIEGALGRAAKAFASWRTVPFAERASLMRRAAAVLRDSPDLAEAITREMGKTIAEARAEVEKCAFACEHYAENAERYLATEAAPSDTPASRIVFDPLGTVLAIMPWNFPLWQVFRFAAPSLMAGNTAVLKHSRNTTRCALNCERVFREAGFPHGVFTTLVVGSEAVERMIQDPRIVAVTLTGSDSTGAKVAANAGANLKRTVLELGGSDAFVVLADADVERAAEVAAKARFQNAGQSCIAAKRFIVVEDVAERFEEAFVAQARAIRVGDPTSEETQMGPLAREDLRDTLLKQLETSTRQGARVLTGGRRLDRPGWFVEPTILGDCDVDMAAFREETFGPLAAVRRVSGEDEAMEVANHSAFGLGGNIWTGDVERGLRLARRMESGGVFINGMTHSDPRLPFGGIKRSGYGRELHSFGIREFVNVKTVWVPGE